LKETVQTVLMASQKGKTISCHAISVRDKFMEVYIGTYESANNTGCYLHLRFISVFAQKRP